MRKFILFSLVILIGLLISSCQSQREIIYTNDDPFVLEMKGEELNILQLTDLHLTFGYDHRDQRTFKLIKHLNDQADFDLIVITGDLTMSPAGPSLFASLIEYMESLETPWTFVFGNHETDYHTYQDFLEVIKDTTYLYFKVGPELENGGVGNFHFTFTKNDIPAFRLYMLDSKAEREIYTEEEGEYDYLSEAQVNWFRNHVQLDFVKHLIFMHVPLRQYIKVEDYEGYFLEDKVYAQGVDTGFFDTMVDLNRSLAIFVGHDHLNDFWFEKEGIMLAYGRATGFNGYGNLEKGGRVISVNPLNNQITTDVLTESGDAA
ncbi:MAG: metallophosphoesterase [Acholeplasmataceae bacterium]